MVPLPSGAILYTQRTTGAVDELRPDGTSVRFLRRKLAVSADGQRGLLGLAMDRGGRLFAAWTDPSDLLRVAQIAPGPKRVVWNGPVSTQFETGGHLAFAPDGKLALGIGELENAHAAANPNSVNGKIVELDPQGPPNQRPTIVSRGWHNPFAFAFASHRELWVADNSPDPAGDRLARGDVGAKPTHVVKLPRETAPSGLAVLRDGRIVVCGYASHRLLVYRVGTGGTPQADGAPLARDCILGVATLADGHLAYAKRDAIRIIANP
jgi:hypothetical protein